MTDTQAAPAVLGTERRAHRLRIASVPSGHVYVRHLAPESGPGPDRLPDPDPSRPDVPAGAVWWPPAMLEPEWAASAEFDLFHLHFGFDACDPAQLERLVATLRRRGKPFVLTVHDLRNPHHQSRAEHDAQLDVLIRAADALVTLTPGAAAEIRRRWGREAVVIPHPHVVELPDLVERRRDRSRRPDGPFRVGLHVKSLRPSMAPLRILPTLVAAVSGLPGAVLQVNAHHDVMDADGQRHDDELSDYLRRSAANGDLDLRVHDFFPDDALWDYLGSLDVSVLPYRFGTHSGWLEACRDLGTTVVAPSCGFYAEQGPVLGYHHDEESFDAESLAAAVMTAYRDRPQLGVSVEERREQRRQVAAAHDRLYRIARRVSPLRVCLIASNRYPVRQPFAGGLEALTHQLARQLVRRGHEVTLFAAPGSDPALPVAELDVRDIRFSRAALRDVNAPAEEWMTDHHAYLSLMLDLARDGSRRFDIVHNNSLHHLPVAMASMVGVPVLTTLHTPPTPWLESAMEASATSVECTAVSRRTAAAWRHVVDATVVHNGVDLDHWKPGRRGSSAVWTGRLVAEKAPHLAIDAAGLAGLPLVLAGPAPDPAYFDREIAPRLGGGARYVGHLDHTRLAALVADSAVAVVTPAWDEPFGLVAIEAMACGTPVAALPRGALPEIVVDGAGSLAAGDTAADLAEAIRRALACDRFAVRDHVARHFSAARMVDGYEDHYAMLLDERSVA